MRDRLVSLVWTTVPVLVMDGVLDLVMTLLFIVGIGTMWVDGLKLVRRNIGANSMNGNLQRVVMRGQATAASDPLTSSRCGLDRPAELDELVLLSLIPLPEHLLDRPLCIDLIYLLTVRPSIGTIADKLLEVPCIPT